MKPYCQGGVDYFCAIYSIINSVRLASRPYKKFTYLESCDFYQHLIRYLYDTNRFLEVLYEGTTIELMNELLNVTGKYLNKKYGLKLFHKPPLKFRDYDIKNLGKYIGEYVSRKGNSCIFRFYYGKDEEHWSVIRSAIFTHKLKMFDSCSYNQLDLKRSTWEQMKKNNLFHLKKEGLILIKIKP